MKNQANTSSPASVKPRSIRRMAPPTASPAAAPAAFQLDPQRLFGHSAVITVLGQVQDWTLQWAGRIHCTLRLSIGDIPLSANRDSMPLEIGQGSWVRAQLLLRPASSGATACLLSATHGKLIKGEPSTAWLPTQPYHRQAHMRRLRLLLSHMEPALQAIFMAVMGEAQIQKGFFTRLAASDHHSYPGGLFDCSIRAAELAYQQRDFSASERDLAALACLLFDLGKVLDPHYGADLGRGRLSLAPHAQTAGLLGRVLETLDSVEPELVAGLRSLLARCDWTEWLSPPGLMPSLKQRVHQCLQQAWQWSPPLDDAKTTSGAAS